MVENLRIHFIAIGFKYDWVVKSLDISKADKVYLFSKDNEKEIPALTAQKEIITILKKRHIDYKILSYTKNDLFSLLRTIRETIKTEKENFIYLNISGGEREVILTFTLSSMLFKNIPKGIKLYSMEQGDFNRLPSFEARLPTTELIESMRFIATNNNQCRKKDLKKHVFDNKIIRIDKKTESNEYMKLNRGIVDKLLQWNLIEVEGKGKGSLIKLKEDGQNLIKFL